MPLMSSFLPSLLLVFLLSLNTTHLICHASDSITPDQPLSGTGTINSIGGRFELGFFDPSNSSQRYYLGIWFKQIPEKTVVWVANRETPLNTTNPILKISEDGNLHLLSPSNVSIWSTNLTSTAPSNSTVAVLLESGNLVLRDGNNSSLIHWQSFDYTTDTLLPGNWIGRNKVTGLNKPLTAWKSKEDPAPGLFSMEIDPNQSQYLILWNGTQPYWTTGVWDGKVFRGMPEMAQHFRSALTFVDNQTGSYFIYTVYDPSILSYTMMDVSGQVKTFFLGQGSTRFGGLYWYRPKNQCDVYALCGSFGSCNELSNPNYCSCLPGFTPKVQKDWGLGSWSDGCMRRTPLLQQVAENSTANVEADRFWVLPYMKLPNSSESFPARSAAECKLACLNRRSCTAYSFESRCLLWNGDLMNVQQLSHGDASGRTLFLRLAASEVSIPKSRKGMIAGIVVGSAVALGFALGIVLFVIRRHQEQRKAKLKEALARGSLVAFSYRDLQRVTKNFSEKIGGGGFGSVFKGTLPDLSMVAVKKLEGISQGEKQFRMEVSTIGTIQHVNLIRLRGFCSEGNNKLLVYDYMPNGSLGSHVFGRTTYLDWSRRYQIAIETARGLAYLHEKCRDCIIHCDIKPENILLDNEFCVKIADFGLAKLFGRDFSHVITTMRGTAGYLAPEWISGLAISAKADVYSYGMMLFEIISGRRNREESVKGQTKSFPVWAMERMLEGDVESLLDDRLVGNSNMEEVHRACRAAGWCIQDHENERLSMGQIVQILEGALEVSVAPIPRLLKALEENCNSVSSLKLPSTPSDLSSVPSPIKS